MDEIRDKKSGRWLKGHNGAVTHAQTVGGKRTKLYTCWRNMINRCRYEGNERSKTYCLRGIRVCEEWQSFQNFARDMGEPPSPIHSLERINVNGNYCPENCKWIPIQEQQNNTTRSRTLTYNGKTMCLSQWAREFGFPDRLLRKRMRLGWSIERAVTSPWIRDKNGKGIRGQGEKNWREKLQEGL